MNIFKKKTLGETTGIHDGDGALGRPTIYTEDKIDILLKSIGERLANIEVKLGEIEKERFVLKSSLEELYKQNLKLVEKYGKKHNG